MNRESKQKTRLTLFDPEYSSDLFLYHYTSFKNACKILYSNSLKFSSLSNTNDTNESKPPVKPVVCSAPRRGYCWLDPWKGL